MTQSDPFTLADLRQPVLVGTVGREVIAVSLDGKPRALQDLRKGVAEVAIGEEDACQAARSKTTASSTAAFVRS